MLEFGNIMDDIYHTSSKRLNDAIKSEISAENYEHLKQHNTRAGKSSNFPEMRVRTAVYFRPDFIPGNGNSLSVAKDEILIYFHGRFIDGVYDVANGSNRMAQRMFNELQYAFCVSPMIAPIVPQFEEALVANDFEKVPRILLPTLNEIVGLKRRT